MGPCNDTFGGVVEGAIAGLAVDAIHQERVIVNRCPPEVGSRSASTSPRSARFLPSARRPATASTPDDVPANGMRPSNLMRSAENDEFGGVAMGAL